MTDIESKESKKVDNTAVFKKFDNLLSSISLEHLNICLCQTEISKRIYKKKLEEIEKMMERAKRSDISEDEQEILYGSLERKAKEETLVDTSKYCKQNNIRCPVERETIRHTLELFNEHYDLADARVFMVVQSVVNHQLSAHRMQHYSSECGILQEHTDRDGNVSYKMNPVEEAKRKFDDSIIKAMEILNKIIEGEIHTIKGGLVVVSAAELFGDNKYEKSYDNVRVIE